MSTPAPFQQVLQPALPSAQRPPRWRRIVLRSLIGLLASVVLWSLGESYSLYRAKTAFQKAVAAHRAVGEPVLPEDFVFPDPAPEDNAATFILRAADAIHMTDEQERFFQVTVWDYLPLLIAHDDELGRILDANKSALAAVDESRSRSQVRWEPMAFVLSNNTLNHLNNVRYIADLVRADAFYQHHHGNDWIAIARAEVSFPTNGGRAKVIS